MAHLWHHHLNPANPSPVYGIPAPPWTNACAAQQFKVHLKEGKVAFALVSI